MESLHGSLSIKLPRILVDCVTLTMTLVLSWALTKGQTKFLYYDNHSEYDNELKKSRISPVEKGECILHSKTLHEKNNY